MIAVINPQELPAVEIELGGILKVGMRFRIKSVKDFYGPPIVSGIFDGHAVGVPMKAVTPPSPVGLPKAKLPVTEPGFAAFVVLPE